MKRKGDIIMRKKNLISVIVSIAVVASLLTGCGSSEKAETQVETASTETAKEEKVEEDAVES